MRQPAKGARTPTDDDRALAHAVVHAVRAAIGEAEFKPGPHDTIMDDDTRSRLERAYEALRGIAWGTSPAEFFDQVELPNALAQLLRLREQARRYRGVRKHRAKPDAPHAEGIQETGTEIVQQLRHVLYLEGARSRWLSQAQATTLAQWIDALEEGAVNLGGSGGAGGGRTPEQWARSFVLGLRDPDALRADQAKRARRSGRRKPTDGE